MWWVVALADPLGNPSTTTARSPERGGLQSSLDRIQHAASKILRAIEAGG
jgi:hypothetical protein